MRATTQIIRYLLIALGCCLLVAAGVLLLWYVGVFQALLSTPEKVAIVAYILEYIDAQEAFVSGNLAGETFQVSLSGTARSFGFLLLGLFSLAIFAGLIKALVFGGVEILKAAAAMQVSAGGDGQERSDIHVHKVVR